MISKERSELHVLFEARLTPQTLNGGMHVQLISILKRGADPEPIERITLLKQPFEKTEEAVAAISSALDPTRQPVHQHLAIAFLSGRKRTDIEEILYGPAPVNSTVAENHAKEAKVRAKMHRRQNRKKKKSLKRKRGKKN